MAEQRPFKRSRRYSTSQDTEFPEIHELCQDPNSPLWDNFSPAFFPSTSVVYSSDLYKNIHLYQPGPSNLTTQLGEQFPANGAVPAAPGYNGYPQPGQAAAEGPWHVNLPPRAPPAAPTSWTDFAQLSDIVTRPVYATHSVPQPVYSQIASTANTYSNRSAYSQPIISTGNKCALPPTPSDLRPPTRVYAEIICGIAGCVKTFKDKDRRTRHQDVVHAMAKQHYHCRVLNCNWWYPRSDKIGDHFKLKHRGYVPEGCVPVPGEDYDDINDAVMLEMGFCYFYGPHERCEWLDKKIQCGFVAKPVSWLGQCEDLGLV